jgi:hypothetical protein
MINLTNLMKPNTDNCRVHWRSLVAMLRQSVVHAGLPADRLSDQVDRDDVALIISGYAHFGGDIAGDVTQSLCRG